VAWASWRVTDERLFPERPSGSPFYPAQSLALLRLAVIPPAAYLLLTTTVHPWYVALVIPLLPFLLPQQAQASYSSRFLWPWLYFSIAVALSYLTYWDPENLRELHFVRGVEYIPVYLLLFLAAIPVDRVVDLVKRLNGRRSART
jgi:hypothetical protein